MGAKQYVEFMTRKAVGLYIDEVKHHNYKNNAGCYTPALLPDPQNRI